MPEITMPLRELGFGLAFERKAVRGLRDFVGGFEEGFENLNEVIPVLCIDGVLGDQAIEVTGKAHGVPLCERAIMASTIPQVPCAGSMPSGWLGFKSQCTECDWPRASRHAEQV